MNFTFYNRADYFSALVKDVGTTKLGDRVAITAISIDTTQPAIQSLLDELAQAAQRGVKVTLLIDAFEFLMSRHHLPVPYTSGKLKQRRREASPNHDGLRKLEGAGVRLVVINHPKRGFHLSYAGRSHLKAAVINNMVYVGCCNLDDVRYFDVMVGWHATAEAADWLYRMFQDLAENGSTQAAFRGTDIRYRLASHAEILIDAGVRHQSLILDTAYHLIDTATDRLFLTCQYFPGGSTARHLLAAHRRGVDVSVLYSHPTVHKTEAPLHYLQQAWGKFRLPGKLTAGRQPKSFPKLHAKILASEAEAVVGSHNFVAQGVALGTAEIALHVKDPTFASRLREFMEAQIKQ